MLQSIQAEVEKQVRSPAYIIIRQCVVVRSSLDITIYDTILELEEAEAVSMTYDHRDMKFRS